MRYTRLRLRAGRCVQRALIETLHCIEGNDWLRTNGAITLHLPQSGSHFIPLAADPPLHAIDLPLLPSHTFRCIHYRHLLPPLTSKRQVGSITAMRAPMHLAKLLLPTLHLRSHQDDLRQRRMSRSTLDQIRNMT